MAPRLDLQLEKLIDGALKHSHFQALEDFLHDASNEGIIPKCSKNVINKLDMLINRELNKDNIKQASLGLSCLHKFASSDSQSLGGMIDQGLVQKISIPQVCDMVPWYEKARKMWLEAGKLYNEPLLNLAEDFLDALLAIFENSKEGKYQVTQTFLYHIGHLATEREVHILIQKEVVRKLNVILDKIPVELKKERKILLSEEALAVMKKLASRILESGDYDLQIALMEALCRMTTRVQRQEFGSCWFKMDFVVTAFNKIQDSEFETDCRKFLNLVNGMQGDKRRVYSYPCLEAFLGKHELLMPSDEKLDEFWVDFNVESRSISFYFSLADQEAEDGKWDTVCIFENEVQSYTVKEEDSRKVLRVLLTAPLYLSGIEDSKLIIHFSSSLDILQAVASVYGTAKHSKFMWKNRSSVVKTTVQIILDEGSSQVVVPESQLSSAPSMDRDLLRLQRSTNQISDHPGSLPEHQTKLEPLQAMTPAKKKMSVSCTYVSTSGASKVGVSPCSAVLPAVTPLSRNKVKPALKMVSSSEKKENTIRDLMMTKISQSISAVNTLCYSRSQQHLQHIPPDKVLEMEQDSVMEKRGDRNSNIVQDSQPSARKRRSILPVQKNSEPSRRKCSVSEVMLPGERDHSCEGPSPLQKVLSQGPCRQLPPTGDVQHNTGEISHQELHLQLTQRLEELLQEREKKEPVKSCRIQGGLQKKGEQAEKRSPAEQGKAPEPQGTETPQKASRPKSKAPNSKNKLNSTKSSIQKKAKAEELTSSMMTFISSQYRSTAMALGSAPHQTPTVGNRSDLKKSLPFASMEKGARRHSGIKFSSHLETEPPEDDVYSFKLEVSDKYKSLKQKLASDSSGLRDSRCFSRSVKKGPPPSRHPHPKKHLFSDTDTDSKTDISWLRVSAQKPKLKIVPYTRQRPNKPAPVPAPDMTYESSDLATAPSKPLDEPTKRKKGRQRKKRQAKENVEKPAVSKPTGRPKRESALSKSYKEPSDFSSTSQSEVEDLRQRQLQARKKVGSRGVENGTNAAHQPGVKKNPPAVMKDKALENRQSCASPFSSHPPTPPPVERMRSADKTVLLPRGPFSPLHSLSVSPIGTSPLETARPHWVSKTSSNCKASKTTTSGEVPQPTSLFSESQKTSKLPPALSCTTQYQSRSVCSILSPLEPLLSSTAQNKAKREASVVCQLPEEQLDELQNSPRLSTPFMKNSLASMATHHQATLELHNNLVAITGKQEKTPALSPSRTKPLQCKEHVSGPCFSLKRPASPVSFSSSDEEREKEHGKQRHIGKLKPRKLFDSKEGHVEKKKACTSAQFGVSSLRRVESSFEEEDEDEENKENSIGKARAALGMVPESFSSVQEHSSTDTAREGRSVISSHMVSSSWGPSEECDMTLAVPEISASQHFGSVCHQLSSDIKRKLQNRSRRMDLFSKQSLKTVQQHVSSVFVQIQEYRTQRLERVRKSLFDEIRSLEQDNITLKNMEKELTTYWNKQSQAFHAIQERGAQRLQHLMSTFQTNLCPITENEEHIFTSKMCLMRRDMKAIEDKIFKDMHEEELLSVRRALQAWLLPARAGL